MWIIVAAGYVAFLSNQLKKLVRLRHGDNTGWRAERLAKLDALLLEPEPSLKLVCALGAYIKRRLNLQLIAEGNDCVPSRELCYCLRESLEYLLAGGVLCECVQEGDETLSSAVVLFAYDLFQAALEAALPSLTTLLVRVSVRDGRITLRLVMEDAQNLMPVDWRKGELARLDVRLESEKQDGTLFYTLSLPKGGDAA